MKIQSMSIVVPNKQCINSCKFCVSRMHTEDYPNMLDDNLPFHDLYQKDYIDRLAFARDQGCNTLLITGNSEPQQNKTFLMRLGDYNRMLSSPFRWIEMQTTGALLDEQYLRFLRNHVRVSTISLSLSSLNNEINAEYNDAKIPKARIDIEDLCKKIKKYDFNLRLSLNMTDGFDWMDPEDIFVVAKTLGADQIIFRVLYESGNNTPQDRWIQEHRCASDLMEQITQYILDNGREIRKLEFGRTAYSVHGMSTVVDNDCMAKEVKEELKYVILRPNGKLYCQWDDPASLIFYGVVRVNDAIKSFLDGLAELSRKHNIYIDCQCGALIDNSNDITLARFLCARRDCGYDCYSGEDMWELIESE